MVGTANTIEEVMGATTSELACTSSLTLTLSLRSMMRPVSRISGWKTSRRRSP